MKRLIGDLQIGTKLIVGFGCVLLLTLVVGLTGAYGINLLLSRQTKVEMADQLKMLVDSTNSRINDYKTAAGKEEVEQIRQQIKEIQNYIERVKHQHSSVDESAIVDKVYEQVRNYSTIFDKLVEINAQWDAIDQHGLGLVRSLYTNYGMLVQQLRNQGQSQAFTTALDASNDWYRITTELIRLVESGQDVPIDLVTTQFDHVIELTSQLSSSPAAELAKKNVAMLKEFASLGNQRPPIDAALMQVREKQQALSREVQGNIQALISLQSQKSHRDSRRVILLVTLTTALALVIGLFFALFIRRLIVRPMLEVVSAVKSIAGGDLTLSLNSTRKDELGQLSHHIDMMNQSLRHLMIEVVSGVHELIMVSSKVASIASRSATSMQTQRDETDQVAAAMNEMTATLSEVTNNAETTALATRETDSLVNKGNDMLSNTVASIDSLAEDLGYTSQTMEELKKQTDNVSSVLEVIKQVAEQTNLLALNAAIEAARAGETGRGFAVVADEVRTLANRTQTLANEIEEQVSVLQSGAQTSFEKMILSRNLSTQSAEKSKEVGSLFKDIIARVSRVQDMNQHIATAAEQQSQTAEEINRRVENVRVLTDETAQGSLESNQAAEQLKQISQQLQGLVDKFKV